LQLIDHQSVKVDSIILEFQPPSASLDFGAFTGLCLATQIFSLPADWNSQ